MIQNSIADMLPPTGKMPVSVIASPDVGTDKDFAAILNAETVGGSGAPVSHAEMMPAKVSLTPALPASISGLSDDASGDPVAGLGTFLSDLAGIGSGAQDAVDLVDDALSGSEQATGALALPLISAPEGSDETLTDIQFVAPEIVPAPGTLDLAAAGSGPADGQDPTPNVITDEQGTEELGALWPDVLVSLPTMASQAPAVAKRAATVSSANPGPDQPVSIQTGPPLTAQPGANLQSTPQTFADLSNDASAFRVKVEAMAAPNSGADPDVEASGLPVGSTAQPAPDAARAPIAPPPPPVSTARPEWPETFVQTVQGLPMKDGEKLTIALTPERLGAVQVRMEIVDGVANVAIVTESPEAAKLFVEHQQRLADLLARNGIEMGGQSVSTSADGSSAGQRDAGHSGQFGDPGEGGDALAIDETQMAPLLTDAVRRSGLVDVTA